MSNGCNTSPRLTRIVETWYRASNSTHESAQRMESIPFLEPPIKRTTDSLPVTDTSAAMIDMNRVAEHIAGASDRGRYTGPSDPLAYLQQRQCLVPVGDVLYASLAGLLCFGRDPQALFPNAVVDIGHYRGVQTLSTEVVNLEKNIGGTIFEQIARVERYLWTNTRHGMTLSDTSLQRVELHEYPRAVVRELIVNTVAHRDYAQFLSNARVELYQNRVEWVSPGGLPPGITVHNILDAQMSRNPVVLTILYEAGFMEAFGQGLNTVDSVLREEQMAPPLFRDTGVSFIVTIHGRPLDVMQRDTGIPLNDTQRMILALLQAQGPLAPRELQEFFPTRAERSLRRDLAGLVAKKLITSFGGTRALTYRINASNIDGLT